MKEYCEHAVPLNQYCPDCAQYDWDYQIEIDRQEREHYENLDSIERENEARQAWEEDPDWAAREEYEGTAIWLPENWRRLNI